MQLAGADEQNVTLFDLEAAFLLGSQNVVYHDALAPFNPVDAADVRNVNQHSAGDNALMCLFDRTEGRTHAGGHQMGRFPVVGLPVPEEMGQRIDVGNSNAVEDHAKVVGGGRIRTRAHFVSGGPAFSALNHEVHRHIVRCVDAGFEGYGSGHGDPYAILDCGDGLFHLGRCDVVWCAQFIVITPFAPIGQFVKITENFIFAGYVCLWHGLSPG